MHNIWDLLLQTGTVSLAALVLLAVKRLLKDKLSPRWQYWLWGLLALRILIPARAGRAVVLGLGLPLERLRTGVEARLSSVFSDPWIPVGPDGILPAISGTPRSVTDWLFILWWAGAALYLAIRLTGYIRLRMLLRRGTPVSPALQTRIGAVCAAHGCRPCRAVEVAGLPSAFVCGVFRPVLAVPAGEAIDDKVLLHELLHLRHRDPLQTALWCLLRALHWCNPFLQYVFDRIGNDLESLCDQRVLERLEGEQLREYGAILLTMAAGRYARMPGTSSVSNGSKNIARRIEAIARFKRYPRGMGLAAFCILLVMAQPLLAGDALAVTTYDLQPSRAEGLDNALALIRIRRCTTLPGALDTYAKGLMLENGLYIAAASPLEKQPVLKQAMEQQQEGNAPIYQLDPGRGMRYADAGTGYQICSLQKQADDSYTCWLAFAVYAYDPGEGPELEYSGTVQGQGTCFVPVRARVENGAWVVEEAGSEADRILSVLGYLQVTMNDNCDLPPRAETRVETAHGALAIESRSTHSISNTVTTGGFLFDSVSFDRNFKPDALWDEHTVSNFVYYTPSDRTAIREFVEVRVRSFPSREEAEKFAYPADGLKGGYAAGNAIGTWYGVTYDRLEEQTAFSAATGFGAEAQIFDPVWYRVQIRWDDQVVEEFVVQEGDHVGP